jgi:ABC-type maltose transport system permease subunit
VSVADTIALRAPRYRPRTIKLPLGRVPMVILSLAWLAIAIYPIYYVAIVSVETRTKFFSNHSLLLPADITGANYATTFQNGILH